MILVGDIGGTKTILALFASSDTTSVLKKHYYASADYASFSTLLADFLSDIDSQQITACCLGVAGPIVNGDCSTTNLPWVLHRHVIHSQLGIAQVTLLNDLVATAWGVLSLPEYEFVSLNPDARVQQGNMAILAAGTGLGEAIIAWNGSQYHVMATEGGHTDFAPTNEQEIALLRYLMNKHPDHVSSERVISGEGLINIYQFLKDIGYAPAQAAIEQQMATGDKAAIIGTAGNAGSDALCVATLNIFSRLYGAETGNLALKCLPYGGIYLAGGIAAKILPFLQNSEFMARYLAKGRFLSLLKGIPIKICTNPEVGLFGALNYAAKII
jgi:glucokinase